MKKPRFPYLRLNKENRLWELVVLDTVKYQIVDISDAKIKYLMEVWGYNETQAIQILSKVENSKRAYSKGA